MVDKLLRSELGDNWGIDQTTGQLRFFGAGADGSIRFAVDSDTGKAAIEKKNSGVWQGTELIIAPGTLYLGESLGLSAAGHHLMAEHSEGTHKHLYAHRPVTSTGTADEVTVLKLTDHVIREISHSDESTTMVGNALNYQVVATKRVMLEKVYLKTGSTAATAPVTLRVYDGPDNTYPLMWKWTYPIIAFPANSEIELDIPGFLEYEAGETTSAYYSSTAAFSLKGSTGGQPWRATDNYTAIEENMLATTEFVSGNSYTKGEWYVDGATKKVYICNKTGTQTGTFSANSANWSPITADRSGVTGLLSGSILSVPTTSTLSWTAGEGQIVDYSDPSAPAIADLIWDAVASYTPSKLTTNGLHFIAYDSTGTIHDLLGTEITSTHIKDYIIFGRFFIFYGNIVYSESRPMNLGYDAAGSFLDHMLSIEGNGKISGNVYSANGANLSMNVTAGKLFILHGNFRTDPKLPNTLTTSAATAMDISHSVRTTTGRANYYANNAFVDVAKYDDGSGTPATVPAGKWTIQRIYRDGNSATEMALGQQLFDSQEEALVSVGHDNFVEAPEILINSLCGVLIVQAETTNLSLPAQARFVTAGNHRGDGFTDLDGYKDISPNAKRVQTSGLLEGGAITGNTATQVSWGAGNGIITDYTDPEAPAIIKVSWDAVTNHTLTNIAIDDTTIFCYDVSGSIVEVLSSTIAPLDSRRYIGIGSATHRSGAIISTSTAPGNLGYDGVGTLRDFLQYIIGPANISGNVYDANGANMTIDVVGGLALIPGANFRSDSQVPDTPTLASGTAISFSRVYNEGSSSENIAFESTSTTLIDPTKYDDGSGTLATVNTNYWTIQHIFRSRTGGTYVAYGQAQYATKTLAVAALPNISVMEKNPLPLTLYRANLVVKQSATALNDDAQAEFFERSAFRAFGVSGSGSTIPGITSPGGLDTQVQINDGGAFGGDSTLTFNKTTKLLTVQQISGTLADGVTATTQSSGDNSTKVATTAYVSAEALWESATGGVIPKSGISTDIIGSYNNTKILDTCESSFGGFASLLSYSNSKIGTYSLGFPLQANVTNLSSFMISGRDFGDLTDFSNDNDSLEFWIYAGIAPTISTSFVQLGNTANTQVYQWDTLPTIVNGWNKIILKMGDATETGTVDWSTGVDYFEYNIVYSTGGVASTISIDDLRMTSPRKESISRDLALNGDVQVFGTLTGNLLGTINTATTAVTQSAGNNSTLVATTAYADAAVSAGNLWSKAGTVLSPKTAGDAVFIYEGANPICKLWDGDGNDAGTLSLFTGTTQYVHFSADEDSWITGGNLGIGDDDPMSDLHVRCNYPTPSTTVGVTLEQAGLGDCVFHYYLTGGQRIDTGIDNSTTNDDFVIGSGNFGTKYLEINTVTNTVTVSNLLGTLSNGVTATTQTAGNNSTLVATTAFVTSAVSGIVFWSRGGTTLSPNTAGDSILTTGDITGANLTGSKLDIVSTATTTRPMILTANNLTTAPAFYISSNSGDASARYLMELVNNDSNSVLTGGITIDNNGGGSGFDLTNENTTLDALDVDCDSLTTGGIANFKSNSTSTASRSLVTIHNDSTLATGTVGLKIIQDSTGLALETNGDISAGGVRASDGLFQPVYPSDDRLILDLPFREIGSVLQYDRSSYANNPSLVGTVAATLDSGLLGDSGMVWSSTLGYVDLLDFDSGTFDDGITMEIWSYPTATKSFAPLFTIGNGASGDNIWIERWGQNTALRVNVQDGVTQLDGIDTGFGTYPINEWTHILATITKAGAVKVYVNGKEEATGTVKGINAIARTENHIGYRYGITSVQYYVGNMARAKIYKRVLEPIEAQTSYLRGHGENSRSVLISDELKIHGTAGVSHGVITTNIASFAGQLVAPSIKTTTYGRFGQNIIVNEGTYLPDDMQGMSMGYDFSNTRSYISSLRRVSGSTTNKEPLYFDGSSFTFNTGSINGTLADGVTGTTQSPGDNTTKVATTAFVVAEISAGVLWERAGTVLSPATAGDDITTTGDLTAANITAGSNLGISQTGITNLVIGNTTGKSKLYFGQATNNNLVIEWTYDATPADAFARITTWGYVNDLYIDAKVLSLQTNNSAGQVGIGTDDPQAKLDVRGNIRIGDWTSADVSFIGVPASGGDFNIGQTSGAGKVKIISNVGADLVIFPNTGGMGVGKYPIHTADINGITRSVGFIAETDTSLYQDAYESRSGEVLSITFADVGQTIQYDSGPYANNATGSSASLVTSTAGPYGSGALLNGSTDYFTLDNTTVLPAGAAVRTFEIEFETDDITLGSYTLFSYGTHISANRFAIQQIDNSIRVFTLDSAAETTATITTGKRYTLGVTYNGTQINAWLNGVKIMSDISLVMGTSSGTTAYIGSLDGTQDFFKGKIGFVRAYDRVLADDEMTAPYLRARGDTVIRSNEAKMISTSDVVSHISGYDPAYVVDVFSLSDLPTASAGVITLEAKMYVFHSIVVFSDGLVIPDDSTTILKMPEYGFNTYLLYTGTGTFITGASNAGLRIIDASIGMTGAGAKCFDVNGTVGLDFLSIICLGTNQTLGTLTGEAVDARTGNARFVARRSDFTGYSEGFTLTNLQIFVIDNVNFAASSSGTSFSIKLQGALSRPSVISSAGFTSGASGSCIDISPTIENQVTIEHAPDIGSGDYFTTGTTGTFTVVADASVSAEAITTVTNVSGVARFNFSAPPTLFVNQEVVISGFTTNTAYNGTFIITATGSSYFEVSSIAYGSDETGSFLSNSVTLTDTGTTLVDGDAISIDTDGSTDYDTGTYVYNKQTNSVQVNKTWTATATGTWDTGSLTQDSKYVNAQGNNELTDSASIASCFSSGNSSDTTTSTSSYLPLDLGTVTTGQSNSRFKLINTTTGEYEYNGLNTLGCTMHASISASKSSTSRIYNFRFYKTSGTDAFDVVIASMDVSSRIGSVTLNTSAILNPGDRFRVEVEAEENDNDITITNFSMVVE